MIPLLVLASLRLTSGAWNPEIAQACVAISCAGTPLLLEAKSSGFPTPPGGRETTRPPFRADPIDVRVGSAAHFWNPAYFGNPASGVIDRANRLLVGEAALAGTGMPATPPSWTEDYFPGLVGLSQLSGGSAIGALGVTGYARTSDYRRWISRASGGSQGVTGTAVNDDATPNTTPIAAGVVGEALRMPGVNGITLNQFDAGNGGALVDSDPVTGVNSGSTWAIGLTAGTQKQATGDITAMMYLGSGNVAKARKGIISIAGALDPGVGQGGGGVFAEMPSGQSLRWIGPSHEVAGEFYAGADGFHVRNAPLTVAQSVQAQHFLSTAAAPVISECGDRPPPPAEGSANAGGEFTLGSGDVRSCTLTYAEPFPHQAFPTVTPSGRPVGSFYIARRDRRGFTLVLERPAPGAAFLYQVSGN